MPDAKFCKFPFEFSYEKNRYDSNGFKREFLSSSKKCNRNTNHFYSFVRQLIVRSGLFRSNEACILIWSISVLARSIELVLNVIRTMVKFYFEVKYIKDHEKYICKTKKNC